MEIRKINSLADEMLIRAVELGAENVSLLRQGEVERAAVADKDKNEALVARQRLLDIPGEIDGFVRRFRLSPWEDQSLQRSGMFLVGKDPDRIVSITDRESGLSSIDKTDDYLDSPDELPRSRADEVSEKAESSSVSDLSPLQANGVLSLKNKTGEVVEPISEIKVPEPEPVRQEGKKQTWRIRLTGGQRVTMEALLAGNKEGTDYGSYRIIDISRVLFEEELRANGLSGRELNQVLQSKSGIVITGRDSFINNALKKVENPGHPSDLVFDEFLNSITAGHRDSLATLVKASRREISYQQFQEEFKLATGVEFKLPARVVKESEIESSPDVSKTQTMELTVDSSLGLELGQDPKVEILSRIQAEVLVEVAATVTTPLLPHDSSNGNSLLKDKAKPGIVNPDMVAPAVKLHSYAGLRSTTEVLPAGLVDGSRLQSKRWEQERADELQFSWSEMLLLTQGLREGPVDDKEKLFLTAYINNLRSNSQVVSMAEEVPQIASNLVGKLRLLNEPGGKEMARSIDDPQIQAVLAIYDRVKVDAIASESNGVVSSPPVPEIKKDITVTPVETTPASGRMTFLPPRLARQQRQPDISVIEKRPPELTNAEKLVFVVGLLDLKPQQQRERGFQLTSEDYEILQAMYRGYRTDPQARDRATFRHAQRTAPEKVRQIRLGLEHGIIKAEDLPEDLRRLAHLLAAKRGQNEVGKI